MPKPRMRYIPPHRLPSVWRGDTPPTIPGRWICYDRDDLALVQGGGPPVPQAPTMEGAYTAWVRRRRWKRHWGGIASAISACLGMRHP